MQQEVTKENAIADMKELAGPADPSEARAKFPRSLRALYGTDAIKNAIHCSSHAEAATEEIELIFNKLSQGYGFATSIDPSIN